MRIKICGLTDETAVTAAVEAGVDALGFVFAESPRQVSPARARELCTRVPPGIARVAVTHHPSLTLLKEILADFEPDCLQSDAEDFKELEVRRGPHLIPVYREAVAEPGLFPTRRDRERTRFEPDFVYEGAVSGQGQAVDWQRAAGFVSRGRMLLAGGLTPANVSQAIMMVKPWGVDVSSGVENAPGKKDPALIQKFVAAARSVEQKLSEGLQA